MNLCGIMRWAYSSLLEKKRNRYIQGLIAKGLKLGRDVEIIDSFFFDPSHCFLISIGDNCTICPNVRLIAHDASTKKFLGYTKIARIDIKENCFIGDSTIVLPGVTIGPNVVIGTGSVLARDIPAGFVAVENPSRPIKTLHEYLDRIRAIRERKGLFSENYSIERLNESKRMEILVSIGNTIGFIV